MERRNFLKMAGLSVAAVGCAGAIAVTPEYTLVIPPKKADEVPVGDQLFNQLNTQKMRAMREMVRERKSRWVIDGMRKHKNLDFDYVLRVVEGTLRNNMLKRFNAAETEWLIEPGWLVGGTS